MRRRANLDPGHVGPRRIFLKLLDDLPKLNIFSGKNYFPELFQLKDFDRAINIWDWSPQRRQPVEKRFDMMKTLRAKTMNTVMTNISQKALH